LGAALSIVVLFTISSTIVRVAAVFLEHTGISRDIARIQAMSALSGTGFTTSESELLLQTPERRRILVVLMITGSVGLASVVATVVVGAFGIKETASGVLLQFAAIIAAIAFVRYVLFSPLVDEFICGIAHAWLVKRMAHVPFTVLYQLDADRAIAEHTLAMSPPSRQEDWPKGLTLIGVRSAFNAEASPWDGTPLPDRSAMILAGPRAAHHEFAAAYGLTADTEAH
jgi:hypothetical protein